jgi:hypothetical protein
MIVQGDQAKCTGIPVGGDKIRSQAHHVVKVNNFDAISRDDRSQASRCGRPEKILVWLKRAKRQTVDRQPFVNIKVESSRRIGFGRQVSCQHCDVVAVCS